MVGKDRQRVGERPMPELVQPYLPLWLPQGNRPANIRKPLRRQHRLRIPHTVRIGCAIAVPVFACDAQLVWPRVAGLATTSGVCTAKGRGMRKVESALTWWCTAASTTAPASHRTRCVVTNTPTRGVLVVTVVRVTEPVRLPRRLGRCRLQHPSMQAVCEGHP